MWWTASCSQLSLVWRSCGVLCDEHVEACGRVQVSVDVVRYLTGCLEIIISVVWLLKVHSTKSGGVMGHRILWENKMGEREMWEGDCKRMGERGTRWAWIMLRTLVPLYKMDSYRGNHSVVTDWGRDLSRFWWILVVLSGHDKKIQKTDNSRAVTAALYVISS